MAASRVVRFARGVVFRFRRRRGLARPFVLSEARRRAHDEALARAVPYAPRALRDR